MGKMGRLDRAVLCQIDDDGRRPYLLLQKREMTIYRVTGLRAELA